MTADALRHLIRDFIDAELDPEDVHLQGKRIIVDDNGIKLIILVTEVRSE